MIDITDLLDKEEKKIKAECRMVSDIRMLKGDSDELAEYAQKLIADQVTVNTWRHSFGRVMENGIKNKTLPHKKVSKLLRKYSAKTILGVAFGGSLRQNIDELVRVKDKYIIMMADRGVNYLLSKGIRPTYIVSMDAVIDPIYLGKHDLTGIDLVASIGTNHAFIARFLELGGRDIYFLVTEDRLGIHNILTKEFDLESEVVRIPGNVGNGIIKVALDVFYCKKLLLAGFDYAFTDYYYPDTATTESISIDSFKMIDINDQQCRTTRQLFLYASWAGKAIGECYKGFDRVVNCSEAGILRLPLLGRLKDY